MPATIPWYRTLAWKFFLATGMAFLAVMGVVLWVTNAQATRGAMASGQGALVTSAQVLDRQFRQEARVLEAGAEVFAAQSWNLSLLDEAIRRQDRATVVDALVQNLPNAKADLALVATPNGQAFASSLGETPLDVSHTTAIQMALAPEEASAAGRDGPSYTGFHRIPSGSGAGLYLLVARPLVLPGGTRLGALALGLRLGDERTRALRDLLAAPGPTAGHLAILAEGRVTGTTLGPDDQEALGSLLASQEAAQALGELRQGRRSAPLAWTLQGAPHLLMLSPLRGEDGASLGTATARVLPLAPYARPYHHIRQTVLGASLAGLGLALMVALARARGVTAPLQRLTQAATALARGERPDIPEAGADEVGALASAFNHLLSELRAKDELLENLAHLAREEGATGLRLSRASLAVVDVEATAYLPGIADTGPTQPQTRRMTLREGDVFNGRYRIDSILGKGGMGVVFRARDLTLDEDVAVKVIHPEHPLTPAFLDQLKQELKLARRITHRHVLRTHDFGEAEGIPYVTMEYLRGVTLRQLMDDRGRLPLPMTLRIARQVAEGLEAAHSEGVVHRDVKPHNVFFDLRGDVKLLDFGLAAPVASATAGSEGRVFGTPRYMSPEQVKSEAVDARTDLYAFGVMLFELATGEAPFVATGITEQLRLHLEAPVPPMAGRMEGYPDGFEHLVRHLLAKRKEDRPGSAAEVAERLRLIGRTLDQTHRL